MAVCILMPAFNEGGTLASTLLGLRANAENFGQIDVIVVDDGSDVAIRPEQLPPASPHFTVILARHTINLGQGAALETARRIALGRGDYDAYVTMDSDGQHRLEDLPALIAPLKSGADVAFGNRFRGDSNVPPIRRAVLFAAGIFERIVTGLALQDAHNGYRAFNKKALALCPIHQSRMAHATEIKQRIAAAQRRHGVKIAEVPVSIRYTEESLGKGQSSLGAFTILRDLFFRYLFEEGS